MQRGDNCIRKQACDSSSSVGWNVPCSFLKYVRQKNKGLQGCVCGRTSLMRIRERGNASAAWAPSRSRGNAWSSYDSDGMIRRFNAAQYRGYLQ
jgi:hypothetical protein